VGYRPRATAEPGPTTCDARPIDEPISGSALDGLAPDVSTPTGRPYLCRHRRQRGDRVLHQRAARLDRGNAGKRVLVGFNDLAHVDRRLASEWHPTRNETLTPSDVTAGSGKVVWWQDKLGHAWQVSVNNRTIGRTGCPYCTNNVVLAGFNDLATVNPDVAAQWHQTRNGDLTPQVVAGQSGK
jgi:hypothetical protein